MLGLALENSCIACPNRMKMKCQPQVSSQTEHQAPSQLNSRVEAPAKRMDICQDIGHLPREWWGRFLTCQFAAHGRLKTPRDSGNPKTKGHRTTSLRRAFTPSDLAESLSTIGQFRSGGPLASSQKYAGRKSKKPEAGYFFAAFFFFFGAASSPSAAAISSVTSSFTF